MTERIDLGDYGFPELVKAEGIPAGEIWAAPDGVPVSPRLLEALRDGTATAGGLAEAGWRSVGRMAEDGFTFGDPHRDVGDWPAGPVPTTSGIRR